MHKRNSEQEGSNDLSEILCESSDFTLDFDCEGVPAKIGVWTQTIPEGSLLKAISDSSSPHFFPAHFRRVHMEDERSAVNKRRRASEMAAPPPALTAVMHQPSPESSVSSPQGVTSRMVSIEAPSNALTASGVSSSSGSQYHAVETNPAHSAHAGPGYNVSHGVAMGGQPHIDGGAPSHAVRQLPADVPGSGIKDSEANALSIRRPHLAPPNVPSEIELSTRFEDDYEIGEQLGRGTFSVVRKCTYRATGEQRAVKVIDVKRFRLGSTFRATSVLDEVRILRTLNHPNIIHVYGAYESSNYDGTSSGSSASRAGAGPSVGAAARGGGSEAILIVTELAAGGELFDSIIKAGNFTEPQARHVIYQSLKALEYLHDKGIVHRDLKPENLLVLGTKFVPELDPVVRPGRQYPSTQDEANAARASDPSHSPSTPMLQVKIADFGVARYVGAAAYSSGATTFVGSPQYVAPEVLFSRDSGPRGPGYGRAVDVYSMGIILYVMLAGYLPFDEGAPIPPENFGQMQQLANENGGRMPSWEEKVKRGLFFFAPPVWTHISASVKDLIRQMMAVDPKQRFTVQQALAHPWFEPILAAERDFEMQQHQALHAAAVAQHAHAAAAAAAQQSQLVAANHASRIVPPPLPPTMPPPGTFVNGQHQQYQQHPGMMRPTAMSNGNVYVVPPGHLNVGASNSAAVAGGVQGYPNQHMMYNPAPGAAPYPLDVSESHNASVTGGGFAGGISAGAGMMLDQNFSMPDISSMHVSSPPASGRTAYTAVGGSGGGLVNQLRHVQEAATSPLNAALGMLQPGAGASSSSPSTAALAQMQQFAPAYPQQHAYARQQQRLLMDAGAEGAGHSHPHAGFGGAGVGMAHGAVGSPISLTGSGSMIGSIDTGSVSTRGSPAVEIHSSSNRPGGIGMGGPGAGAASSSAYGGYQQYYDSNMAGAGAGAAAGGGMGLGRAADVDVAGANAQMAVAVYQTVSRSIDFHKLLDMQRAVAATMESAYNAVKNIREGAIEVRRHAVAMRELQQQVKFVMQKCQNITTSILAIMHELTDSVQDGNIGLMKAVFSQMKDWVADLKTQAQSIRSSYSQLIRQVQDSVERARPLLTMNHDHRYHVAAGAAAAATAPTPSSDGNFHQLPPLPQGSGSPEFRPHIGGIRKVSTADSAGMPGPADGMGTDGAGGSGSSVGGPAHFDDAGTGSHYSNAMDTDEDLKQRDVHLLFLDTARAVADQQDFRRILTNLNIDLQTQASGGSVGSASNRRSSTASPPPVSRDSQHHHHQQPGSSPLHGSSSPVPHFAPLSAQSSTSTTSTTTPNSASAGAVVPISEGASDMQVIIQTSQHGHAMRDDGACLACALSQLQAVDSILMQAVDFWSSMELVIDAIVSRKVHSEMLFTYSTKSQSSKDKAERTILEYKAFWSAFTLLCGSYANALAVETPNMYAWLSAPVAPQITAGPIPLPVTHALPAPSPGLEALPGASAGFHHDGAVIPYTGGGLIRGIMR